MTTLKREDVQWEIIPQSEDIPVRGNVMASGDPVFDRKVEDEVLAKMEDTIWAWCCVQVKGTVTFPDGQAELSASTYLGGCSYEGEEDWKKENYEQMQDEVLTELNKFAARWKT